jgi:hypothetical protein
LAGIRPRRGALYRRGLSHHAAGDDDQAATDWDQHLRIAEDSEHAEEIAQLRAVC